MSDDDLIRRGDALVIAQGMNNGWTAKAIARAIAALPAVTVGVKPLVWTRPRKLDEGGAAYDAHTTCGQYIATDTGWFLVGRSGWLVATSLETAKAAAQADYEARILAALEPQPAPDAAAIREAVADLADFLDAQHKSHMTGLGRNPADYMSGYSVARDMARDILITEKPHDRA